MQNKERQALIAKADSAAYKALREKHLDEFNTFKVEAAADLGVEWAPRKSPEAKARDEVSRILRDYPEIRSELVAEIRSQVSEQSE